MRTVRKTVLVTAALVCAALVLVPFVSAAGPGQGSNPGSDQGPGTFMQGPSQGSFANQGQNTGQGSGSQDQGSAADSHQMPDHAFGNMTGPQPDGNSTWDGLGLNANNITFGPPPAGMNATADNNWTVPGGMTTGWPGWGNGTAPADNMTAPNGTAPPPRGDNLTGSQNLPAGSNPAGTGLRDGNGPGAGSQQQGSGASQAQNQDQKDTDLIAAFLKWLRGGGSSSS